MSGHMKGPWEFGAGGDTSNFAARLQVRPKGEFPHGLWIADCGGNEANARLIAAAPAMAIALKLIELKLARFEVSPVGILVEFCFDGLRHVFSGDWCSTITGCGWDKCRAAIAKAEGKS